MTAPDLSLFLDSTANLSNDVLSNVFGQMPNGIAYCRMLFKDDTPYDYVYLFTNPAFHSLTDLGAVEGKLFSEIIPGFGVSSPELFNIFGSVAAGGLAENVDIFIEVLQRWFSVQVFSPKPKHFIAIFFVINQHKSVEQALVKSEQRYKALLEDQSEIICRFNADGTIIFVNEAFCRLFGQSQESLIGQTYQPVVWPEDILLVTEKLNSLSASNPVITIEYRIVTADGMLRWGQFINRAFFDDKGVLLEMQSVGRDITEQKQVEVALYKSQRDLNHAQAVAHIGSWRIDLSNQKLEWSDETYRIFGIPKSTPLTYQTFIDCVHPADQQLVDAAWTYALTGKPYDIDHRIIVDQKIKWVREQAELEFDDYGSSLSGFGPVEDITEIKSSQEALQQERSFLRQVIDAVPNVIFVRDRERHRINRREL